MCRQRCINAGFNIVWQKHENDEAVDLKAELNFDIARKKVFCSPNSATARYSRSANIVCTPN